MANYSIRQFHGNIDKWINAVDSGLTDCIEIFAGKVQEALVNGSPVDTGRFKGNWQVTANKPPLYALNQYDKDGQQTIAEGKRAIYAIMRGGGAVRSIHFSNMLIYANALEYGHSKQAPAGVVGIVAIRLRSFMAEAIKESRAKNAL
ncbi:tail completion or Neck1 protein [Escherichia phage vB_EcoS_W011D]|uniref:Neck protein n=1 Tax=Escherichia phage vB_EcoS_W011D TaxID=2575323 RepID=A0A4Y5NSJ3_9CAUD|nr:tail completion or Neck1 protein [Escherichia phage vB_EcoS_W011D]QCW18524.1 hypothetical protein vBEcoSW011D_84 [Escherichia phage vB_EcoS_W011D]